MWRAYKAISIISRKKHESCPDALTEKEKCTAELRKSLKDKESAIEFVSKELEQMKELFESRENEDHAKFEQQIYEKDAKIEEFRSMIGTSRLTVESLTATLSQRDSQLTTIKQTYEAKLCTENERVRTTEGEMRALLREVERQKHAAAQFARTFMG
eukprot:53198_1